MGAVSFDVIMLFMGMAFLSYITPGPDWMIISRHALQGAKRGIWAATGVQCGLLFHMLVGALGASAILVTSPLAFNLLQLAGALYLVWLGMTALSSLQGLRSSSPSQADAQPTELPSYRGVFFQGLLANVLNPKAALFFISILPQFVSDRGGMVSQVFLLGGIDILVGVVWWGIFIFLIHRMQQLLHNAQATRLIEGITGGILLLVGVLLAVRSCWSLLH